VGFTASTTHRRVGEGEKGQYISIVEDWIVFLQERHFWIKWCVRGPCDMSKFRIQVPMLCSA